MNGKLSDVGGQLYVAPAEETRKTWHKRATEDEQLTMDGLPFIIHRSSFLCAMIRAADSSATLFV